MSSSQTSTSTPTATHSAVATLSKKGPLGIIQRPTLAPSPSQIRVRVEWTASTPLDLHQNDGALLVTHPQVLGDCAAGTVVEVGEEVETAGRLKVGDKVFGFVWRSDGERAEQEYVTSEAWKFGKVPEGHTLPSAVTLPNNVVTAWHTFTKDLSLPLPWPKPANYIPENAHQGILIWGGSSSVGQYALQILKYYGYTNVVATASRGHHAALRDLGAAKVVDYRDGEAVEDLVKEGEKIKLVLDCIGSVEGSMKPISRIARAGAKVAVLLPFIVRDSGETEEPVYSMDPNVVDWNERVQVSGVRTHFYHENEYLRDHLMPDIVPALLAKGIVKPNRQRIVEGRTLLERAQKALDALRRKEVSGERLVWRVAEDV